MSANRADQPKVVECLHDWNTSLSTSLIGAETNQRKGIVEVRNIRRRAFNELAQLRKASARALHPRQHGKLIETATFIHLVIASRVCHDIVTCRPKQLCFLFKNFILTARRDTSVLVVDQKQPHQTLMSATEVMLNIMITTTPPTIKPMTRIKAGSSNVVKRNAHAEN